MRIVVAVLCVAACGDGGETLPPAIDGGLDAPLACAPASGAGTTHPGAINAPETWTAAGNPHILPFDTTVTAQITLEPCVVVRIAAAKTISFSPGSRLVAQGTAAQPVTIERRDAGPWATIRAIGGTLSLVHTVVDGGGDPLNTVPIFAAALDIRGNQDLPPQEILHAEFLTVSGSASQGLYIREGGGFSSGSHDVRVMGSTGFPFTAWANLLGTLPTGDYTGNTTDEILVLGNGGHEIIQEDVTIHDRGVPYRVGADITGGRIDVGAGTGLATLTIEPGVRFRFKAGGSVRVETFSGTNPATGALIAVGTATDPIVFTSASAAPQAGDWLGIWYGSLPAASNRLEFARVEYAGGASVSGSDSCPYPTPPFINDAAIRLIGSAAPASAFVRNTTVVDSASHGIDRGFRSDVKIDFLPTNTFTRVARCLQTYPRDVSGACPVPVPCPQ